MRTIRGRNGKNVKVRKRPDISRDVEAERQRLERSREENQRVVERAAQRAERMRETTERSDEIVENAVEDLRAAGVIRR